MSDRSEHFDKALEGLIGALLLSFIIVVAIPLFGGFNFLAQAMDIEQTDAGLEVTRYIWAVVFGMHVLLAGCLYVGYRIGSYLLVSLLIIFFFAEYSIGIVAGLDAIVNPAIELYAGSDRRIYTRQGEPNRSGFIFSVLGMISVFVAAKALWFSNSSENSN